MALAGVFVDVATHFVGKHTVGCVLALAAFGVCSRFVVADFFHVAADFGSHYCADSGSHWCVGFGIRCCVACVDCSLCSRFGGVVSQQFSVAAVVAVAVDWPCFVCRYRLVHCCPGLESVSQLAEWSLGLSAELGLCQWCRWVGQELTAC